MKYSLILSACSLLVLGCKGTVDVNCSDEPDDPACVEICRTNPTDSHCSADGGTDAGPGDGGTDAGPDAPTSNCTTECADDTPICDEDNSMCVQCLLPTDCDSVEGRPMCVGNACVECASNADCSEPGASVCSTDGMSAGTCVGCAAGNAVDCTGIVDGDANDLNVCDESGESPVCVWCNAGDESACGANVCDVLAKVCTDDTPANLGDPCSLCVSDRQCMGDMVCAQESFDGEVTEYRCATLRENVTDNDCFTNNAPYVSANEDVLTASGTLVDVCQLRTTTCASLAHYGNEDCMTLNDAGDALCGISDVDDGYCRMIPMSAANRCTYECASDEDCRGSFGCAVGQTPAVCRLAPL